MRTLLPLLALAVLLGSGCSSRKYNRAWNHPPAPVAAGGLEGRWEGTWKSSHNGHTGKLRCIMTKQSETRYEGWFHSTYGGFLTFQHRTDFTVREEGDAFRFTGEQDLGWLAGGVYRYDGTVRGDDFTSTYHAENGDHGMFELKRAVPPLVD